MMDAVPDRTAIDAHGLANKAIGLIQTGSVDAGVRLYCLLFTTQHQFDIPVGLHARLLREAGHDVAATTLLNGALCSGWDIGTGMGPLPVRRREYETLFAAGLGNAGMVNNYLLLLDQMGDGRAIAPWTAHDPLLQCHHLPGGRPDLAQACADLLVKAAEGSGHEAQHKSFRGLRRIRDTHRLPDPALTDLHAVLSSMARTYARSLEDAGHPYARLSAPDFSTYSWGVVSDGAGRNVPHHHGACFVVAVAYLRVPPQTGRGTGDCCLHVGAPEGAADPSAWPAAAIAPEPGLVVLMPGYFCHWTHPYPGGGARVSLACNFRAPHPATADFFPTD